MKNFVSVTCCGMLDAANRFNECVSDCYDREVARGRHELKASVGQKKGRRI